MCYLKCLKCPTTTTTKHKKVQSVEKHSAIDLFPLTFPLKSRSESIESEANFSAALLPLLAPSQQCSALQTSSSGSERQQSLLIVSALRCANQPFIISHGRRRK